MSTIVDTIQAIVRQELRSLRIAELGVVDAVYPHSASDDSDNYGCDVRVKNSGLLLRHVPVMTGHIGTVAVPNVGDLVLLAFEQGDVNQPLLVGRLYDDADRPPLNNPNEIISRLPLHNSDDQTIKTAFRNISDNNPPREILIEMPPKITVHITDAAVDIKAGAMEVTLDQQGDSGGTVTIKAGDQTTITMDQDGDITINIDSTHDISLTAQNVNITGRESVNISAQQSVNISAQQATLTGDGTTTVGGPTSTSTVQGASVLINGMTTFSPA